MLLSHIYNFPLLTAQNQSKIRRDWEEYLNLQQDFENFYLGNLNAAILYPILLDL